jgi:hypothetical protein
MADIKVTPTFSSGHLATTLLTLLLVICVLIDLITIAFGYSRVVFLSRMLTGEMVSHTALTADDAGQQLVRTTLIAAYFISGVIFLVWLYRARRNLLAVGSRGQRYSSPWAIGLFFVPLLNLYYPYDIVTELWKQSNPDVGLSDAFLKQHASTLQQYSSKTALIGLWWGLVIASVVVARISGTIASHATDIPDLISESWTGMISDALRIVGTIILIVLVNRIDVRLEEKHKRHIFDAQTI